MKKKTTEKNDNFFGMFVKWLFLKLKIPKLTSVKSSTKLTIFIVKKPWIAQVRAIDEIFLFLGLSSKLRHNKNPFPSMVGVESKNSTQNNHLSMGGKLSPLELTPMCPSSSGGSPSPFNGAKEGHSLGSPLSPSSVIRSSLDHFDKFTNITTANNTANKSNSEKVRKLFMI